MTRTIRTTPVLPGQSRSTACRRTKGCARLDGHKRACRATLSRAIVTPIVATKPRVTTKSSPILLDRTFTVAGETWHVVVLADGSAVSTRVVESPAKAVEKGVEVHSADRYAVRPDDRTTGRPRTARRPKAQCRVVKAGTRCSRAYGHKATGTRHNFAGATTILPTVEPKGRDVQTVAVKHSRTRGYIESRQPSARLA